MRGTGDPAIPWGGKEYRRLQAAERHAEESKRAVFDGFTHQEEPERSSNPLMFSIFTTFEW